MNKKPKVLLGMSGGVDSSVSAVLLLEAGYEVIGAFMKNWSGDVNGPEVKGTDRIGTSFEECGWKTERRDAMRVAAQLGIPFLTFDFETEYRRDVVEYMFREFEAGRTPNPDVMCNRYMKFDLFLKEADKLGCDFIATGHYARTENPLLIEEGAGGSVSRTRILKGIDPNKDQTYFLWAIDKAVLPRVLFPIGHLEKPVVREIAAKHNLEVATKKDSTGICFVGEVDMREFLKARMKEEPGNVVTTDGKVIGKHIGINFYTIGQRHGLDIGGGDPYYVVEKRRETNEVVVGSNFHPALFKKELTASQLNWFKEPQFPIECEARLRHRQPVQKCMVSREGDNQVHVTFSEPQRAVTPGQSIVFYVGDEMIGGGIID
ncbi:tRNA 2-thiouridine(34) synthase MnmA [Candidatus Uhrbacteria bacterium RIFOXYB2_FULL_45_11]|uniref:tRNA-specific 2-thiouridylase MnmA n=1 Tax=Candidatus Uhrbacteria bacterium RIFOXYB2_FULL_45_11 TaxID=1802421 RepID=A0A1F7W4K8_9BACT|nr:MAG: tRNA 2-thiouridine(34) synthase MnmA [Candidatus Uhrbacteria bacterium RIFOXYB2_FULL_45_11]